MDQFIECWGFVDLSCKIKISLVTFDVKWLQPPTLKEWCNTSDGNVTLAPIFRIGAMWHVDGSYMCLLQKSQELPNLDIKNHGPVMKIHEIPMLSRLDVW